MALEVVALELVEEAAPHWRSWWRRSWPPLELVELVEESALEVVGAALAGRFAFVVLLQPDLASLQLALMVVVEVVAPAT